MEIKNELENLEKQIKKSKDCLSAFMYLPKVDVIFSPAIFFKKSFKKKFTLVNNYVHIVNDELSKHNLDFKLEEFVACDDEPNRAKESILSGYRTDEYPEVYVGDHLYELQHVKRLNRYNQKLQYLEQLEKQIEELKGML